jgi:hypothetical protein
MKNINIFIIIFLLISASVHSQTDVSIKKNEFKTKKEGFKEAWNHVSRANSYYKDGGVWYSNALIEFQSANIYNPGNAELNYKIGVSCLFSDKKDEASDFLIKAYELKNDVAGDILFLTGRALIYKGKYSEASLKLNNYLLSSEKKSKQRVSLVNKYIGECDSALTVSRDSIRIEINNIGGNINSTADDYSEVLFAGGKKMLFASRRALKPNSRNYYADTKFDENIFVADYVNGMWGVGILFDKNLTTTLCETPLYMNKTETELYIYVGYEGGGDIMVSEMKKREWKSPNPEGFGINSQAAETSLSFSPSGKEIAFVSNREKSGQGGKDIFIIKEVNKRKWSKPLNLGPAVNSKFDEESVRFSAGGDTLWFSSRGHNTIGGFDIFYSTRTKDGKWGAAVNAGYPLNTPWDELFYCPIPGDDKSFLFVSNRSGGLGGLDIYSGKFLPPLPESVPVILPETIQPVVVKDSIVARDSLSVPDSNKIPVILQNPDTLIAKDTSMVIDTSKIKKELMDNLPEQTIEEPFKFNPDVPNYSSRFPFLRKPEDADLRRYGFKGIVPGPHKLEIPYIRGYAC